MEQKKFWESTCSCQRFTKLFRALRCILTVTGKCKDQDAHFFICDYLTIDHELPDPTRLGEKLAELHHKSESPTESLAFTAPFSTDCW